MTVFGMHWIDWCVIGVYFSAVIYAGVYQGGKRTKTLGDFFVAGGKWGSLASFIFVFASAIAGNEAVVVARGGFEGGLSGVWYWWSFLFATPVYYLFATHFRRGRVYNIAEFIEMRFGTGVAILYSATAGLICLLFIGMFLLAIGKILGPMVPVFSDMSLNITLFIWVIAVVVGAYVCTGGMMSALITDIFQGLMCLFILGFVGLPFLWNEAGGYEALRTLPASTWDMTSDSMTLSTVLALNLAALVGGIAAPWLYNWIAISKDEKAATQCGWGHLWKRVLTLFFALYGILFLLYNANVLSLAEPAAAAQITADPEVAWGVVMKRILPPFFVGLLIASFFAAAMSSADTYATTAAAMWADFLYRRVFARGKTQAHYLLVARIWTGSCVVIAAVSTLFISSIGDYIKLGFNLLCFLGVPIYFAVWWRKANRLGMWLAFVLGSGSYLLVVFYYVLVHEVPFFGVIKDAFEPAVFISTALSILGMVVGSLLGRPEEDLKVKRFHVILNTPVGSEARLVEAGVRLPALLDKGLVPDGPEELDREKIEALYAADSEDKVFGSNSSWEFRRERTLPWYFPGFVRITLSCIALVLLTWLATKVLFVWT